MISRNQFLLKLNYQYIKILMCNINQYASVNNHNVKQENVKPKIVHDISRKHLYQLICPWKNVDEFTDYIYNNIVYNEDGLIAINKPYAVAVHKKFEHEVPKTTKRTSTASNVPETTYTLEDSLYGLKKRLNLKELTIVKSPERYTSGITLLTTNSKTFDKVRKSVQNNPKPFMTYWAITKGYPQPQSGQERLALKMNVNDEGQNQPDIVDIFSKRDVKFQKVKPVKVDFKTLSVNKELSVALWEIATTSIKWHFLRLYTTRKTTCVLGDMMYSSRVKLILGKSIVLPSKSNLNNQELSESICQRLQIPQGSKGHATIPTMLHLNKMILQQYLSNSDLVIVAPPPNYFQWTCEQLELIYENETVPVLLKEPFD